MRRNRVLKALGGWMLFAMVMTLFSAAVYAADDPPPKTPSTSTQALATATASPIAPAQVASPTALPQSSPTSAPFDANAWLESLTPEQQSVYWGSVYYHSLRQNMLLVQEDADLLLEQVGTDLFVLLNQAKDVEASILEVQENASLSAVRTAILESNMQLALSRLEATLDGLVAPEVVPEDDVTAFLRLCESVFWEASFLFRSYYFTFDGGRQASCQNGEIVSTALP